MNVLQRIIGSFRPRPPGQGLKPEPPTERKRHLYQVTKDGLSPTASSLEEYYEIQDLRHQANEIFRVMNYALELATEDNSPLDSDPRERHVKLDQHKFELHPESGFRLSEGEVQVQGHLQRVETTRVSDNWMAKNQKAIWDRTAQSFALSFESDNGPPMPSSPEQLVQQGVSKTGADDRANQILSAARFWERKAEGLDNSAQDIQSESGIVVAPNLNIDSGPLLSEAFYAGQNGPVSFSTFDIETSPNGTIVVGNPQQGHPFGAKLSSSRNTEGIQIVFERPEIGTTEKVQWVVADGVLHYEKYKKG